MVDVLLECAQVVTSHATWAELFNQSVHLNTFKLTRTYKVTEQQRKNLSGVEFYIYLYFCECMYICVCVSVCVCVCVFVCEHQVFSIITQATSYFYTHADNHTGIHAQTHTQTHTHTHQLMKLPVGPIGSGHAGLQTLVRMCTSPFLPAWWT